MWTSLQHLCSPLPVNAGEPAVAVAEALLRHQTVLQLVLNAEGMRRGGLILRAGVLLQVRVGQSRLGSQPIHGVKGQDVLQEVYGWEEEKTGASVWISCI